MKAGERDRFDALLQKVLDALPAHLRDLLEEKPLIVEDRPSPELAAEIGVDPADPDDILCGLHTGASITERSVESQPELEMIHLFRDGIIEMAGGWRPTVDVDGEACGGEDAIIEQIRITLLHEIGHHFGLEEDDLRDLGYD